MSEAEQVRKFKLAMRAIGAAIEATEPAYRWIAAEDAAHELVGAARTFMGVACERCNGVGRRVYGSTATWRGGIGGQMLTPGVCDLCWGSGRTDRKGVNLRKFEAMQKRLAELEPKP